MREPIPQPGHFVWTEHKDDPEFGHHWRGVAEGTHDALEQEVVRAHEDSFRADLGCLTLTGDAGGFEESKRFAEVALRALIDMGNALNNPPAPSIGPDLSILSAREREVLAHLQLGKRPPEIAKALFISVGTVRGHLKQCFRKTGARGQVALLALVRGKAAA